MELVCDVQTKSFPADCYPVRLLCQTKLKSELSKQQAACYMFSVCLLQPPQENPAIAFFWPSGWHQDLLVKHHSCIELGKCADPADLLCLLCPFCVCILFLSLHLCRDFFVLNPLIAAKYLIFFGSCFHIFDSGEKSPSSIYISAKDYIHVRLQWVNLRWDTVKAEDEQVHK